MNDTSGDPSRIKCVRCGFTASNPDEWDQGNHPALGAIPKCPECGSKTTTNISNIHIEDE